MIFSDRIKELHRKNAKWDSFKRCIIFGSFENIRDMETVFYAKLRFLHAYRIGKKGLLLTGGNSFAVCSRVSDRLPQFLLNPKKEHTQMLKEHFEKVMKQGFFTIHDEEKDKYFDIKFTYIMAEPKRKVGDLIAVPR